MRSLINKWNLEKPQLQITEDFIVGVNDEPLFILDATLALQEAQTRMDKLQEFGNEMTEEQVKEFADAYAQLKNSFYSAIELLLDNKDDLNKIKEMNLSINNLTILFNELIATAQHREEEDEEEASGSEK